MLHLFVSAIVVTTGFVAVVRFLPGLWHLVLAFVFLTLVYAIAHAKPVRYGELPYCGGPNGMLESCFVSTDVNPRPRFTRNGPQCPSGWILYRAKHNRRMGYCEERV